VTSLLKMTGCGRTLLTSFPRVLVCYSRLLLTVVAMLQTLSVIKMGILSASITRGLNIVFELGYQTMMELVSNVAMISMVT